MHGKGEYYWADGRKYIVNKFKLQGEYEFDKKNGYGEYSWANGKVCIYFFIKIGDNGNKVNNMEKEY